MVVIVEEGSIGGFASHVLHHLALRNLMGKAQIIPVTLPDSFIAHGSPAEQYKDAGLDSDGIVERIMAARLGQSSGRPLHLKSASATMA